MTNEKMAEIALMLWARQHNLEIVSARFVPREDEESKEESA